MHFHLCSFKLLVLYEYHNKAFDKRPYIITFNSEGAGGGISQKLIPEIVLFDKLSQELGVLSRS